MSKEFEHVQRLSHDHADLPAAVEVFRFILYDLKRRILDSLDSGDVNSETNQDIRRVNDVSKKIKQLGNILKIILRSQDPEKDFKERADIYPILELFESLEPMRSHSFKCPSCHKKHSLDGKLNCTACNTQVQPLVFKTLDPESRNLCLYYVGIDIDLLPFDLSSDHANSVRSK